MIETQKANERRRGAEIYRWKAADLKNSASELELRLVLFRGFGVIKVLILAVFDEANIGKSAESKR